MISWLEKHSKISWTITILIAIVIFYMSTKTSKSLPSVGSNSYSVFYHLLAFFFLAFFLSISLVKRKRKGFILISITIAILYGLSDEIHQFFVPGRSCTLQDAFTDIVGVSFASLIYFITIVYRNKKFANSHRPASPSLR